MAVELLALGDIEALADRGWCEGPPQHARDALYGCLSRLRGIFAAADELGIVRKPGGCVLTVDLMAAARCRRRSLPVRR